MRARRACLVYIRASATTTPFVSAITQPFEGRAPEHVSAELGAKVPQARPSCHMCTSCAQKPSVRASTRRSLPVPVLRIRRAPPRPLHRSPLQLHQIAHLGAHHPSSPHPRTRPRRAGARTHAPARVAPTRRPGRRRAQAARACASACCTAAVSNGCSRVSTRGSAMSETMVRVVRKEQP